MADVLTLCPNASHLPEPGSDEAIRKFVLQAHSLDEPVALGTLRAQAARLLEAAVVAGLNVLVAGGRKEIAMMVPTGVRRSR